MASKTCASCLRTLKRQSILIDRKAQTSPGVPSSLRFSTSTIHHAKSQAAKPMQDNRALPDQQSIMPEREEQDVVKPVELPTRGLVNALKQHNKARDRAGSTYEIYGSTELIYDLCKNQASYEIPQAAEKDAEMPKTEDGEDLGVGKGWWFNEMGLKPTFSTWSQVTMLHMYMFLVRFRCFSERDAKLLQQNLVDHFFYDAEDGMVLNHRMNARGTRNKYLKDIFIQWRGCIAAYDEGIIRGDTFLAAAIWRNVFKADGDIDFGKLALTVSYMRRFLSTLDKLSDADIIAADVELTHPREEYTLVGSRSKLLSQRLDKASAQGAAAKS